MDSQSPLCFSDWLDYSIEVPNAYKWDFEEAHEKSHGFASNFFCRYHFTVFHSMEPDAMASHGKWVWFRTVHDKFRFRVLDSISQSHRDAQVGDRPYTLIDYYWGISPCMMDGLLSCGLEWFDYHIFHFRTNTPESRITLRSHNPLDDIITFFRDFEREHVPHLRSPYEDRVARFAEEKAERRLSILGWIKHMRRIREVMREQVLRQCNLEFLAFLALKNVADVPRIPALLRVAEEVKEAMNKSYYPSEFWSNLGLKFDHLPYGPGY